MNQKLYCSRGGKLRTHIEKNIGPHEAEVAPMLRVKDVEAGAKELVARLIGAIRATVGRAGVSDVSA